MISGYVISWFVNYCTVGAFCVLHQDILNFEVVGQQISVSWSSDITLSRAGGLMFNSHAGQNGHRVANGLSPLQHFFKRSYVQPGSYTP